MGEKDENKLFIDCGNGEYQELTEIKEIELDKAEHSNENMQKLSKAFGEFSCTVNIAAESMKKLSAMLNRLQCNNYRKLYGLPMRRKYRK